jgi:iron complex outermembrane recepter protein
MKVFIKKFALFLTALSLTFILIGFLFAQEDVDLARIVVSSTRYGQEILNTPAGITVISQDNIQSSNAQTIPDLLQSQPGVIVRDWIGNGTKVTVDIRGFGEQASLNTIVLIDGRRVNEIDISGVDWTQIPVSQIEKIEILRGSVGSVLYGDNASGGVINIITKKGKGKPSWEIETQAGSYDLNNQRIGVKGAQRSLSYYLSASRDHNHGYRQNSHYYSEDYSSRFSYEVNPEFSLRLDNGLHYSDYGLPGELSDVDLLSMSRRSSKYGDDYAKGRDWYLDSGFTRSFNDWGKLDLDVSYRSRNVSTFWRIFFGGFGNPVRKEMINTVGFTPKYILDKPVSGHDNTLITGIDLYRSDYSSDSFNYSDVVQEFTRINKIAKGYYLQDEFSVNQRLFASSGWRYEKSSYEFDYHNAAGTDTLDQNIGPTKKAFNAGLVWKYADKSSLFGNISRSFRFPATDEYSITWPGHSINTALRPQTAKDYEIGIKHRFNPGLKTDISIFRMEIENELYYDYATFLNKNYDRTRHEGVDLGFETRIAQNLDINGNYSYTRGLFQGGVYDKKTIPMVPRNKASIGLKYLLTGSITFNFLGNYVGERFFINDQANVLSRLNGYFTADINFSYLYHDLSATIGINNILNKKYSEYASSNPATGKKVYYPSPERNFILKMGYKF